MSEPSHADELITRRLKDALALVGTRLLDHIIIAGGEAVSCAERGLALAIASSRARTENLTASRCTISES